MFVYTSHRYKCICIALHRNALRRLEVLRPKACKLLHNSPQLILRVTGFAESDKNLPHTQYRHRHRHRSRACDPQARPGQCRVNWPGTRISMPMAGNWDNKLPIPNWLWLSCIVLDGTY